MQVTKYRIYADGTIVHENDFDEVDNATTYYDDYSEYAIPDVLLDYILDDKG